MRKSIFILGLLILCTANKSIAQSSASASQTIQLQLNPIIEIDASAAVVALGKKAAAPQFNVRSNKDFIVSVNTQAGKEANKTDILSLSLVNTDGNSSYKLTADNQDILNSKHGKDNVFAVNYKAKNTTDKPVDVIYTATQP